MSFANENNIVTKLIVDDSPNLTGHLSIRLFVDIFDIEIKVYKMLLYPIISTDIFYENGSNIDYFYRRWNIFK